MTDPFGLGPRQHENRLAAADAGWAQAFAMEAARIKVALGPVVIAIEHYGSTSVPGLASKPIIDLLVGVPDLVDAETSSAAMVALGYDDRGHDIVPGHYIFGLGEARTHLAHFVQYEGDSWAPPLLFRDRLRASAALRDEYEALKRQLVREDPTDRAAYTMAKGEFVQRVLQG